MVSEQSFIRLLTTEQLRAFKAMLLLDRFTLAKLAGVAGISVGTLSSQLSNWKKEGFLLLEQVGVAPNGRPGQPKKIFKLAADMGHIVRASVLAAEGTFKQPLSANVTALDQMTLVVTAAKLASAAERNLTTVGVVGLLQKLQDYWSGAALFCKDAVRRSEAVRASVYKMKFQELKLR